ncbi:hypothetical protein CLV78_11721 [Aliiruegeria haliotis]|uniref:Probable membrane transporter protein n=1 Tax=Aliiruegeria haliotis TaxID=1280846 RepID=A0A2T0RFD7_9RHOB|nr:sulfite exporter TauE/SafE family protein [Aliiruegeria haliotis]PRY19857.1 hypothetical protein CLV78_11721 [Aliiruegeria haliotis]
MEQLVQLGGLSAGHLVLAIGVTLIASFVKGAVGFAMPMIMVSGLASFLSPELALAALILPTLVTNYQQAFRDGFAAAWRAIRARRVFLSVGAVCLVASAQLVTVLDERVLFALIGVPIVLFGVVQLVGVDISISEGRRLPVEVALAACAGVVGGVSGVWGPPLVLLLTAMGTPKAEQVRTQGVAFGLGAALLTMTHLQTGVLNASTVPLSAAMVVPALIGMRIGQKVHDRLDQRKFRNATLVVLVVAGANLLRRAME